MTFHSKGGGYNRHSEAERIAIHDYGQHAYYLVHVRVDHH